MNALVEILYIASNAMLIPVMATLLGLGLFAMTLLGGALRDAPGRRRWARDRRVALGALRSGTPSSAELSVLLKHFPRNDLLAECGPGAKIRFAATHEEYRRSLALTTFGTRVGPALGLMGTLIPLGPALTALASGDLETLAGRLVVAFSTTVLGLLVGVVCFAVGLVRARWFADDLQWLELLTSDEQEGGHARASA